MEDAITALSRELTKLRTGKPSAGHYKLLFHDSKYDLLFNSITCPMFVAGMLDHIIVETNGVKMSLIHVAVVSVLDSQTLLVTPYDPHVIKLLTLNPARWEPFYFMSRSCTFSVL